MATASFKKLPMLAPKRKMAASAASSAFSRSLSRFVASDLKREIIPSESWRASLWVRSFPLVSASVAVGLGPAVLGVARGDCPDDIVRARLTRLSRRSVKPLKASPPATEASWRAPSYKVSPCFLTSLKKPPRRAPQGLAENDLYASWNSVLRFAWASLSPCFLAACSGVRISSWIWSYATSMLVPGSEERLLHLKVVQILRGGLERVEDQKKLL